MKAKFLSAVTLFLMVTNFFLYAQEPPVEDSHTVYVIREITFDVDGRSKPFALMVNGEFTEGERITGKENFHKYLVTKRQLLLNQRVIETASINYSLGESEADGALPVKLLVHVKDTFNLVILPYPKYDSNNGLSLYMKMRDYNFLGTMSPLRVDVGYSQNKGDNVANIGIDSDTPFMFAGLLWNLNFDNYFNYTFGDTAYYQNVTGLSVQLPWKFTTFTVGFNQYLTVNELNSDDAIYFYGLPNRYSGAYASSELFGSWKIPLPVEVGDFGQLTYTPGISGKINYPYSSMDEARKPVTTFSHSLWFGRVNWIGNLRKGLSASLNNSYSLLYGRDDAPLQVFLEGTASFFWPLTKTIGFSSRLDYRQWWQWSDKQKDWIPYFYAGDVIRGVIDEDIRANYMLSLNLDLPIRIIHFVPSEWYCDPKLHFFDFEMYFSPFVDMALLKGPWNAIKDDPLEGTKFSFSDMITTVGIEILVFPGFFRSFYIRGSIGYDIQKIQKNGLGTKFGIFPAWNEIYVGVDTHY